MKIYIKKQYHNKFGCSFENDIFTDKLETKYITVIYDW